MKFKKSFRLASILSVALTTTCLFAGLASAHVSVKPAESTPEAWETYTMKVPAEKDIPTVKVTLKVPEQAELEQYQPVPGWKTTTDKDDSGKIKTITWEAEAGNGIEAGQFQQFSFVAKNPSAEGQLAWDAYQYYNDGTVVEWTGDEGADTPHSITKITSTPAENTAADTGHGASAGSNTGNASNTAAGSDNAGAGNANTTSTSGNTDSAAAATNDSSNNTMQTVTLILSIVALVVSLVTLFVALRNRQRRA